MRKESPARAPAATASLLILNMAPGIGAATARRFARAGWTVILGARDAADLAGHVAELRPAGAEVHALAVDTADPAALRAAMAEAERLSGGLDTVLLDMTAPCRTDLFAMDDVEVERAVAADIAAALHAIRAAVGLFGARGGRILLTGSGLALEPHPGHAIHGAAAAARRSLVQALANDLLGRNIHIAIATVTTAGAEDVAEALWTLATDPSAGWEVLC